MDIKKWLFRTNEDGYINRENEKLENIDDHFLCRYTDNLHYFNNLFFFSTISRNRHNTSHMKTIISGNYNTHLS